MMVKRFFFDVVFLVVLFFAPWWVALLVGVLGIIIFPNYYECLVAGVLFDILYGGASTSWVTAFGLMGLLVSTVFMFFLEWLKREWRS